MSTLLLSLRMEPEMLAALKTLAARESVRRGEVVSWARIVREAAARTLEEARQGAAPEQERSSPPKT
jgi:hypothetical protein